MSDIESMEDTPLPDEAANAATSEPAGEAPEAETQATDAEVTEAKDAEASTEDKAPAADDVKAEEADTPATETKSQRKRRLRREREQERDRELAQANNRIADLEKRVGGLKEPKYEDFTNPDDYIAERAATAARRANLEDETERAKQEADGAKRGVEAVKAEARRELIKDGQEAHKDFVNVVGNIPLTEDSLGAAMEADNSTEVLYFLGKNPTEAARIASLSPVGQAVEIGRISTTLSTPKPKRQTSAPPPVKPLRGATGKFEKSPEDMSYEEYKKWRSGA